VSNVAVKSTGMVDETFTVPSQGGRPVAFGASAGFFHPAAGPVGVLLCSPWGYEELCCHKSWRVLAEHCAGAGFPTLRFDYPGCGDGLGAMDGVDDVVAWIEAVRQAAAELKRLAGVRRVILAGQGLGALLAREAAPSVEGLVAVVLMAPTAGGRRWARELAAWSAMIDGAIGLERGPLADGAIDVAGFRMTPALAASIRAIDHARAAPSVAVPHLLLARPGRDDDYRDRLAAAGATLETLPYDGYDALVGDPTSAVVPRAAIEALRDWLVRRFPTAGRAAGPRIASSSRLPSRAFAEEGMRFGPDGRLFGILTTPAALGDGPTTAAILLNSGYDHHIGWARSAVDQARALAEAGVAAFRVDGARIGDSPAHDDSPRQVLYSDAQIADVSAAIDVLLFRGFERVLLVGRCSGAYLALGAAVADPRVGGVVLVNIRRLVWDPDEDVDEAIRNSFRSLSNYGSRLLRLDTLRRLVTGDIDVRRVGGDILRRLAQRAGVRLAPVTGRLTKYARLYREVRRRFDLLEARGCRVSMVFSEGDGGLDELATYFGSGGRRLAAYPNVSLTLVPEADHNMTPAPARAALRAHVVDFACRE